MENITEEDNEEAKVMRLRIEEILHTLKGKYWQQSVWLSWEKKHQKPKFTEQINYQRNTLVTLTTFVL